MDEAYFLEDRDGYLIASVESNHLPRRGDFLTIGRIFLHKNDEETGKVEGILACIDAGNYEVLRVMHQWTEDAKVSDYYFAGGCADPAWSYPPTVTIDASGRKASDQEASDFEKMLQKSD